MFPGSTRKPVTPCSTTPAARRACSRPLAFRSPLPRWPRGREARRPRPAAVARHVDGRQSEDLGAAVEGGEVGVIDDAEKLDTALRSKPSKQLRILAFGRPVRPPEPTTRSSAPSSSASISRSTPLCGVSRPTKRTPRRRASGAGEKNRIRASVDDPGSRRRGGELARRIRRYGQKPVEEPRKPCPVASTEAVVGDGGPDAADPRVQRREPAGRASRVVRMDDVRPGERVTEPKREWMGGVPADV